MNRTASPIAGLASLIALISAVPSGLAVGDEGKTPAPGAIPTEVVHLTRDVVDAVLRAHFDPPTRQEMVLSGIKSLYRTTGAPAPGDLARRVSDAADFDQLAMILDESWPRDKPVETLRAALLEGLLKPVAGDSRFMTDKEYQVVEQFAGNRYEGVHIALSKMGEGEDQRQQINMVMAGGPADRAGAKEKDVIEAIDGVATRGMNINEAVDRIRGPLGSAVEFRVHQPDTQETRTLKMTRERLFVPTVVGLSKAPSGEWNHRIDGPDSVAYLRVTKINASTPHELRRIAERLDGDRPRGVIIDLCGLSDCDFHAAVVLADSLLGSGPIGRLQTAGRTITYEADRDEVFRGRSIVVLIDEATQGVSEWLVAALQDNGRARVVGSSRIHWNAQGPAGAVMRARTNPASAPLNERRRLVYESVPVGEGEGWLRLAVGRLDRSAPPTPHVDAADADGEPASPRRLQEVDPLAIHPDYLVRPAVGRNSRAGRPAGASPPADVQSGVDPVNDAYVARALAALHDMEPRPSHPATPARPQESK